MIILNHYHENMILSEQYTTVQVLPRFDLATQFHLIQKTSFRHICHYIFTKNLAKITIMTLKSHDDTSPFTRPL